MLIKSNKILGNFLFLFGCPFVRWQPCKIVDDLIERIQLKDACWKTSFLSHGGVDLILQVSHAHLFLVVPSH